jgi:hypothetical protein
MWQFSKFGRDNLRKLLINQMRVSLERIVPDLNEAEQFQLNRLLKEPEIKRDLKRKFTNFNRILLKLVNLSIFMAVQCFTSDSLHFDIS